jgi:hypothetical protein
VTTSVLVLAACLLLGTVPPEAATPPADFPAAVSAYREARYGQAASAFADLAAAETDAGRAAVLHGNAGTAAARAERWGQAVWHLRRARELSPRDPVVGVNLERVRALLGQGGSEARQFTGTLLALPLHLTPHENDVLCALAGGLALLLLAAWRAGRAGGGTAWLAVALLVFAAGWALYARASWGREASRAVVLAPVVTGRAEPDAHAEMLFRLSAGTVVRWDEARHDWLLIESDAGARGWVPGEDVRPLMR